MGWTSTRGRRDLEGGWDGGLEVRIPSFRIEALIPISSVLEFSRLYLNFIPSPYFVSFDFVCPVQ